MKGTYRTVVGLAFALLFGASGDAMAGPRHFARRGDYVSPIHFHVSKGPPHAAGVTSEPVVFGYANPSWGYVLGSANSYDIDPDRRVLVRGDVYVPSLLSYHACDGTVKIGRIPYVKYPRRRPCGPW